MTETVATHILTVYHEMQDKAEEVDGHLIYKGSLARLIRLNGISQTFYSPIFRSLIDGGYIAIMDRGGRSNPSSVVLLREPQKDELLHLTFDSDRPILTLITRLEALERSTGGMSIVRVLREVEQKIEAMSARLDGLERPSGKRTPKTKS